MSTKNGRDDALRKVQALLAKADSTDFDAEAEALIAKALDLMSRHSIDEAEARAARGSREKPGVYDFEFSSSDSNAAGKLQLLAVVCEAAGVRLVVYSNRRGSNVNRVREDGTNPGVASQWAALAGYEADVDRAKFTYATLLLQALRYAGQDWKEHGHRTNAGQSKFTTSFLFGFSARVSDRLKALKETSPKPTPGKAELVLARDQAVDAALAERFPRTAAKRSRAKGDALGLGLGHEAGGRADLGQSRMGGSKRGIGS